MFLIFMGCSREFATKRVILIKKTQNRLIKDGGAETEPLVRYVET